MTAPGRACPGCGEWNPLIDGYNRNASRPDGHHRLCRACQNAYERARRRRLARRPRERTIADILADRRQATRLLDIGW